MRWTIAALAWLIALPAHAFSVGVETWDTAEGIGFVPLSISNGSVGQDISNSFSSSQNFGPQALAVSVPYDELPSGELPGELPPGELYYTPNLVFRVAAFGSALPPATLETSGTTRNGFVTATFSGKYTLLNNGSIVGSKNFQFAIPPSGSCRGECSFEAFDFQDFGASVIVPTDQLANLNLVLQFSDLVGTLGFDETGITDFVALTGEYDVRAHVSFFFDPAPDPVSQVPIPSALPLFLTALAGLAIFAWRRSRPG